MERKKIGQIQGRISRRLVRNPTIQYIITNFLTKYDYSSLHNFTEIFDEKFHHSKYGKKENWTNTGKDKQKRLVCNPTIQHVIINLYTKYDSSSLHGCGEIFDEKVLRNYGRTDGRTDGMTDRCKPVYPPFFQSGGIKSVTELRKDGRKDGWKDGRIDGQM